MIEGFVFLEPSWMILMIFPLGWIVLNQRHEALKRKDLRAYCEMGSRPWLEVQKKNRRQRSRQRWLFLAIIITVLGTMRPSWNPQPQPLTEEGRDLIFILDVSKSMLAQDARPSRLEVALNAIAEAIDNDSGDRHALMAFAGSPSIRSPLTEDRNFLLKALRETSTDSVEQGGTRIEDALFKVIDKLVSDSPTNTDLILITDGDDLGPFPIKSIDTINEKGLRMIIVGLGDSRRGARIPQKDGFVQYKGREVWSKHYPDYLQKLSDQFTHGIYLNIGTNQFPLKKLLQQLRTNWQGDERIIGETIVYKEGAPFFFALATLLMALGLGVHSRKAIIILTGFVMVNGLSQPSVQASEESSSDNVEQVNVTPSLCAQNYQQNPSDVNAWALAKEMSSGNDFLGAAQLFLDIAEMTQRAELARDAHFNAGLCYIQQAHVTELIPIETIMEMMENEEYITPASEYYQMAMDQFILILRHEPNHQASSDHLTWCHRKVFGEASEENSSEQQPDQQQEGDQQKQESSSKEANDENESSNEDEQDGDPSEQESKNSENASSEGANAMQSAHLELPPPAANPQDLIKMQQEQQLYRKKGAPKNASRVEKDW